MAWAIAAALALIALLLGWRLRVLAARLDAGEDRTQRLERGEVELARFQHDIVGALGEGVGHGELLQRIVRGALHGTGAVSACFYEAQPDGTLRGAAIEGLFPPQKRLPVAPDASAATRAKFIEQVFRSEVLRPGEGVIGAVAAGGAGGEGGLITDAARDARFVDHGDPALRVGSMIAVPVGQGSTLLGVLAVATPAGGVGLTEIEHERMRAFAELAGLALRCHARGAARG